jgi:predicted nucleic acid-binding protein
MKTFQELFGQLNRLKLKKIKQIRQIRLLKQLGWDNSHSVSFLDELKERIAYAKFELRLIELLKDTQVTILN